MSTKTSTHEFQAETKQVLDIVVNSLYKDKEIFVRELISNASDALEKLRRIQLTEKEIADDNLALEISVSTDDTSNQITIQDFGVGMNNDELVENLGTIAHSGSKDFMEALKTDGEKNDALIGKFGVGFYSVFMVAEKVQAYTRSWKKDGDGYCWESDGSGSYTIEGAEGQRRGTKLVIKLKDDFSEFAKEDRIKEIIKKYSAFVQFPVSVNGEKVNTVDAIWMRSKKEIKDEEYEEFYKFQSNEYEGPLMRMHFSADAPLEINSLLFVPKRNMEKMGMFRNENKVALHCRKVLIDSEPKGLFPEWLRFLRGVVDSSDIPLNVSRESMQDSELLRKLNQVLTKRFLRFLNEQSQKEEEKFLEFWNEFGNLVKEGAATDFTYKEDLAKLLRFESTALDAGKLTGFDNYIDRMASDQKEILFLFGKSRESIESGPYLEALKARGLEVLLLTEPVDEYVMQSIREYKETKIISADSEELKLEKLDQEKEGDSLNKKDTKSICKWLKDTLKEKVSEVEVGERLIDSPVCVVGGEGMGGASARRVMKMMQGMEAAMPAPSVKLLINPFNTIIQGLSELVKSDESTAQLVAHQLLDNAMASANLMDDPREMIARSYEALEKITSKNK
ncbi:MAG: molecular chaperone HtpG [Opitutae bacterium]|nr:molecular chaperone HtpG [Opitutae bacterium]|tara:strand:- start:1196 stop:3058 length:1863 start_codon:yes stop_codon:yes gene_type:complete